MSHVFLVTRVDSDRFKKRLMTTIDTLQALGLKFEGIGWQKQLVEIGAIEEADLDRTFLEVVTNKEEVQDNYSQLQSRHPLEASLYQYSEDFELQLKG